MSMAPTPEAAPEATPKASPTARPGWQRMTEHAMAACLAVMAGSVFLNVVLRYGFGMGIAASDELSRLLFVWLVMLGATAAYPQGEHMAFTSLIARFAHRPRVLRPLTALLRVLVLLCCTLMGVGAWQQVLVGMGSVSVVMAYPMALLPLPVLLCSAAIGCMAANELVRSTPLKWAHDAPTE